MAPDLVRLLRDEKAQPKDRIQTQRELLMSAAPQKRKRRVPHKPRAPKPECDFKAERVEAYGDLEDPIGERDLAEFMLHQLKPLLEDLRKRYFAKGFAK